MITKHGLRYGIKPKACFFLFANRVFLFELSLAQVHAQNQHVFLAMNKNSGRGPQPTMVVSSSSGIPIYLILIAPKVADIF